jgi:protein O-mannosyl-transferase
MPRSPSAPTLAPPAGHAWRLPAGMLLLAVLAVAAFIGTLHAGFIWDDDAFLTDNPLIRSADGLRRFWASSDPVDYWPVTSSMLWAEWRLWGPHAAGFHAVNILLHAVECVLLWRVLARLGVPGAFLAAALFAVHPVNVDTVAWITQRKNLMAMLFFLLSVGAFVRAEEGRARPGSPARLLGPWDWASLGAFALAMLSKGSVAPLPAVLLCVVAWRRPLGWTDLRRQAPFAAIAVLLTAVNFRFTVHAAAEVASRTPLLGRLAGAGHVLWFYLSKAAWPSGLSFIYPLWDTDPRSAAAWLPLLFAAALTAALWLLRGRIGRGPFLCWVAFASCLVPVLGLTDVYFMHYSLVSDHYQHLALTAALIPPAAAASWWASRPGQRVPATLFSCAAVVSLLVLSRAHAEDYRDVETLWSSTLAHNPRAWIAYDNLANEYLRQGRAAEARDLCARGLGLEPNQAKLRATQGLALARLGQTEQAVIELRAAAQMDPTAPETFDNLGMVYLERGQLALAGQALEESLRLNPVNFRAMNNLGIALARSGRLDQAADLFTRATIIRSDFADAHYNLGNALHALGRDGEAETAFRRAIESDPGHTGAHVNLGNLLLASGRTEEAIGHYERALELNPRRQDARHNLEVARGRLGVAPGK